MRSIRIDRTKALSGEPHLGHNRYHPDIAAVAEVGEGEEIALETRDALDGQIKPGMAGADLASIDAGVVHPLTGPVFVKGAEPGDLLEIEFTDIIAQPTAFSAIVPGLGFLRDVFTEPFLVHWQIADGWASLGAASRRAHSGGAVHGRLRGGAVGGEARRMDRARAARHRQGRVCAFRPTRPARCRPGPAASPACARCRRARTAAISMRSS